MDVLWACATYLEKLDDGTPSIFGDDLSEEVPNSALRDTEYRDELQRVREDLS